MTAIPDAPKIEVDRRIEAPSREGYDNILGSQDDIQVEQLRSVAVASSKEAKAKRAHHLNLIRYTYNIDEPIELI